ncbi:hypothetical protein I6I10_11220 [Corynebacterium glucuronolyticum]|uniref:Uncharacterized protein n=1 Tax=Corynebacterium glucuronolyticum TaxID=39791 RepID=A0A7T4EEQ1_9CORY|nr:hypothetical protein [Corynebacterium glucuronolyticum]MCT1442767.1 hypothetical protein [Corynebacterium glucuronolyticum]QQB46015.1 hypothetical protein I6I10_11220 [Corynebacterium glucuronolyticum]
MITTRRLILHSYNREINSGGPAFPAGIPRVTLFQREVEYDGRGVLD